jgi:hypothetical protein
MSDVPGLQSVLRDVAIERHDAQPPTSELSSASAAPYGNLSGPARARPSGRDHKRTVPSLLAVASRLPSALMPGVQMGFAVTVPRQLT